MTQKFYQIIYILYTILLVSSGLHAEIKVSQSISDEEIAFEDSVQFQIIVEWEGSQSAYLFRKPLTPFIDRMKIGQFSSSVSTLMRNGVEFTQKKYNYSLIPTSAGLGIIDSISIGYVKRNDSLPNFVVTEPMNVLIANPVAKVKEEEGFNKWYIYAFLLVVVVGVLSFLKLRNKSDSNEKQLTPKELFLDELTVLKKQAGSDIKIFQTELYIALSKYIVTEYAFDVSKVKTDGLIDKLSSAGMSMANAEQINKWLQQAEIDKYAPASQTPGAVVRLESEIRTFFEKI